MINQIRKSNNLIFELSKSDFKKRYTGSYLGIVWAFIQPLIAILLFWFVFQVGFRSTPVNDVPFILWLSCAMIPWNFFADALPSSTNTILENSFLVKKVAFKLELLPVVKIYSSLYVHLFFVVFLIGMFFIYGYSFSLYYLQVFYYLFATIILVLGLSWITSSIVLFFKDTSQIVAMFMQLGFWLTPIFYPIKTIPEKFQFLFKLNPMFYITNGYRNTFIYRRWFWEDWKLTIYFWILTAILLVVGYITFKKLKPHFADVL
ncbi:ABC transporter permease [Paenibacillus sp. JTLBN-2024]|uniref:ABC transporter permease n=1 Tax=Paenibacillus cookii TaxID=157839 RepID=UPI001BB35092|nr:ABC transporter permease [Paenibacillus cookii]